MSGVSAFAVSPVSYAQGRHPACRASSAIQTPPGRAAARQKQTQQSVHVMPVTMAKVCNAFRARRAARWHLGAPQVVHVPEDSMTTLCAAAMRGTKETARVSMVASCALMANSASLHRVSYRLMSCYCCKLWTQGDTFLSQ